jgi:micrococcal nuclease
VSTPAGALALVILLCACQSPGQGNGNADPPDDLIPGRVVRVNDGDSAVVATEDSEIEVRLMGVNAPEQDECHHQDSTDNLAGLIEGASVALEVISTDQFDRTLAYVWLEGVLVNQELVSGGFAIATTPAEDGDPRGEMLLAAEETAFEAGLGLWSETVCGSAGPLPEVVVDARASVFDPSGPDEDVLDEEWVSLTSVETVDAGRWTVRDESSQHRCHLPSGTTIAQGGGLTVTSANGLGPGRQPGVEQRWRHDPGARRFGHGCRATSLRSMMRTVGHIRVNPTCQIGLLDSRSG